MKRQWEQEDLIEHWMLSAWDLGQLGNKTGATRLEFAVLLKFFQRAGRFPAFKNDIPGVVDRLCRNAGWCGPRSLSLIRLARAYH